MGLFGLFSSKRSLQESGILNGSTDRHSHILYGVDDGIKTPEDSLAALAFEESLGVREVWCTPHIMEDVPNTTEALKSRFEELCGIYNGPWQGCPVPYTSYLCRMYTGYDVCV